MQGNRTVVGVDIAKRVFQLHWVDRDTGEIMNVRLSRTKFLEHFANRAPCLIGSSSAARRTMRQNAEAIRIVWPSAHDG